MRLSEAERLARDILDKHDLSDKWEFRWSTGRTFAGKTEFYRSHVAAQKGRAGRLALSRPFCSVNERPQVLDTILHEVAHILAGIRAGHGPAWKAVALKLGANPKSCVSADAVVPPKRYTGVCDKCGYTFYSNSRKSATRCAAPLPGPDGKRSHFNGKCSLGTFQWSYNKVG